MTTHTTDIDIWTPPKLSPRENPFVLVLIFLDQLLAWCVFRGPTFLAGALLETLSAVALQGVAVYEWSPLVFWSIWLPSVAFIWGRRVRWAVRVFLPRLAFWLWRAFFRRLTLGWLLEVAAAWFLRGSLSPPPVLRAEDVNDPSLNGGVLAQTRGRVFAQVANVAHASVTAGGLTPSRVRGRAVWTNRLQHYLGGRPGVVGDLIRGRWLPDLPSSERPLAVNALLGLADQELKLLGGGVLPTSVLEHEVFLVVDSSVGRRVVAPALLAKLSLYACFRPRSQDLLAGLRSRAREWFSEKGVADLASAFVLPDTVELAFNETAPEKLARGRLGAMEEPPSR